MLLSPSHQYPKGSPLVMWIIWFGIFQGLFILHFFAAPKPVPAEEAVAFSLSVVSLCALCGAGFGMALRWLVIPRIPSMIAQLPVMVIGLALCEGSGIIGMFALPSTHNDERMLLFSVAVATVLLSAPIYTLTRKTESSPFHVS